MSGIFLVAHELMQAVRDHFRPYKYKLDEDYARLNNDITS